MAFAGTQANSLPNTVTGYRNSSISITGLTLAARIGAPDITAADTGNLVTGTPLVNQDPIPANFGPAAGSWTATDLSNLVVTIDDTDSTANATASHVYLASRVLAAGNISLIIHNRGAGVATGATQLRINLFCPAQD